MAKSSGSTKKSTSSSPKGISGGNAVVAPTQPKIKAAKVNFGSAPANYSRKIVTVGTTDYYISASPTGYGLQKTRNGRITVSYNDTYQDFRWGDTYGGYISKAKAWGYAKDFIKKREKL